VPDAVEGRRRCTQGGRRGHGALIHLQLRRPGSWRFVFP
jgi:hypothetical protein